MADDKGQVLRVLRVLEALAGYAATGARNADLAASTGASPSNVTRDLALLIQQGWARKSDENGRFYPTPAFARLSFRVLNDFDAAEQQLRDRRANMTGNYKE